MTHTPEHDRLAAGNRAVWLRWGTYIADRSWGTVRENPPEIEDAWKGFPFELARSRAYRWTEDGIAGFSDVEQRLCMTAAFWNGKDPYLKERFFGLTNDEGNHGEDIKDYYFLLDGLPSYSLMKMLYRYPQVEFPYARLRRENAILKQGDPPFNLVDALGNTFTENRYFDIFIEYAKAGPDDILCRITVVNRAAEAAPLHILPHLTFRNTWQHGGDRPNLRADGPETVLVEHPDFDGFRWYVDSPSALLFTENESNIELLADRPNPSPFVKDGIDDAVVRGMTDRVNAAKVGTKCAAHIVHNLMPGETYVVRVRLSPVALGAPFAGFDDVFDARQHEADAFYAGMQPDGISEEERAIQRVALASLCWNNQFYRFRVRQWLKQGEKGAKLGEKASANAKWLHFDAHDVLSVPDRWEYPWLAAWDIAFQLVALCLTDPEYAKAHALTLLGSRYMRDDGAISAFEGDLDTPHPPVFAWAVWHAFCAAPDRRFLRRAYDRLKLHFAWWLRDHQVEPYLFDGGFVGKDNISIIDRNEIPEGGIITQADSTGWMAFFAMYMLKIAVALEDESGAVEFLDHLLAIRQSIQRLWDRRRRFFFDALCLPDGKRIPLHVRSFTGLVPLVAAAALDPAALGRLPRLRGALDAYAADHPDARPGADGRLLLAALPVRQIKELLGVLFDPDEFYGRFGIRSLSKYHAAHPLSLELDGKTHELEYEPGSSPDRMFGGNSNWRGPVWMPLNLVTVEALHTYHGYFGGPVISRGKRRMGAETGARQLAGRLVDLFRRSEKGIRPCMGQNDYLQTDPYWRDYLWFFEYFNAENGYGLGASHQNGWTACVALLLQTGGRPPRR